MIRRRALLNHKDNTSTSLNTPRFIFLRVINVYATATRYDFSELSEFVHGGVRAAIREIGDFARHFL